MMKYVPTLSFAALGLLFLAGCQNAANTNLALTNSNTFSQQQNVNNAKNSHVKDGIYYHNDPMYSFALPEGWSLNENFFSEENRVIIYPGSSLVNTGDGYVGEIEVEVWENASDNDPVEFYLEATGQNLNSSQEVEDFSNGGWVGKKFIGLPGHITQNILLVQKDGFLVAITDMLDLHSVDSLFDEIIATFKTGQ